jgi:hypothetical protein
VSKLPASARPLTDAMAEVLATAPLAELQEAKTWLLSHGQGVSPPALANAVLQARQRVETAPRKAAQAKWEKAEREAFKSDLRANLDAHGRRAAILVARALEETGAAPTWAELCHGLGWPGWWQREVAIRKLAKAGWLVTGTEARSLRPGPKWGQP